MPAYYLYFFGTDGHIRSREDIVCGSDNEAIALADDHEDHSAKELWDRDRLIKAFAARRHEA